MFGQTQIAPVSLKWGLFIRAIKHRRRLFGYHHFFCVFEGVINKNTAFSLGSFCCRSGPVNRSWHMNCFCCPCPCPRFPTLVSTCLPGVVWETFSSMWLVTMLRDKLAEDFLNAKVKPQHCPGTVFFLWIDPPIDINISHDDQRLRCYW